MRPWKGQIRTVGKTRLRKIILAVSARFYFRFPGAFTPTCSTYQLPDFDKLYEEFGKHGIESVYCIAVNDAFVMNAWGKASGLQKVKLIPDGSGEFTRKMGMLVAKDNLGFGLRSWRYAAVINDCFIEQWFVEEGLSDNCETDPYEVSSPQNILETLMSLETESAPDQRSERLTAL
ncbi:peroxiredoxin [Rhizobium mongolense]|uniref:Glutathione-dependent peroxiredoxin n=1 Tax=Rhizobium mongolense TaxID=57676 RepID=A0ABR6J008_9HYPH|nr:peroxiredoxin [Rhizobium mongolense]